MKSFDIWRLLEEPVKGYTEVSYDAEWGKKSSSRKSRPVTEQAVGGDGEGNRSSIEGGGGEGVGNRSSIEGAGGEGVGNRSSIEGGGGDGDGPVEDVRDGEGPIKDVRDGEGSTEDVVGDGEGSMEDVVGDEEGPIEDVKGEEREVEESGAAKWETKEGEKVECDGCGEVHVKGRVAGGKCVEEAKGVHDVEEGEGMEVEDGVSDVITGPNYNKKEKRSN